MFEEQAIIPNFASYPTPNPNPLPAHTDAAQHPMSLGFDGMQNQFAFEHVGAAPSLIGTNSQITDSATYEHSKCSLKMPQQVGGFVGDSNLRPNAEKRNKA
ncbi:hypothetical protein E3N88_42338 [Mikania micrantha]|uniref:Uncharacterized protein n=1 Tax=Mikania micrantha TaxID=192012 RepID=A0A5N6LI13_9ASTR|nr:hypothetical protein E3N88_42338 [Mikania micrantha]